jgi:hypothetical protein
MWLAVCIATDRPEWLSNLLFVWGGGRVTTCGHQESEGVPGFWPLLWYGLPGTLAQSLTVLGLSLPLSTIGDPSIQRLG